MKENNKTIFKNIIRAILLVVLAIIGTGVSIAVAIGIGTIGMGSCISEAECLTLGTLYALPFILTLIILPIVSIIGMFNGNKYFRILATIPSVIILLIFPIGTVMGAIFIWRIYKKQK